MPAGLAFLGLAAYKYAFVSSGFGTEALPGLVSAFQSTRLSLSYMPSVVEWVVAVGFLAGAVWVAGFASEKFLTAKQP